MARPILIAAIFKVLHFGYILKVAAFPTIKSSIPPIIYREVSS